MLQYAKQQGFLNPVFFVDDGYSGTSFERPGFQEMLNEIEAGRVAVVIVKDLSRFGRNSALTGMYTNITFAKYGVRFIAINDNYDTIDPNSVDNDFAGLKNWFNEFYARDTSRKICAVNKAKGERGEPLTSMVPYGYQKGPGEVRTLDCRRGSGAYCSTHFHSLYGGTWTVSDCQTADAGSSVESVSIFTLVRASSAARIISSALLTVCTVKNAARILSVQLFWKSLFGRTSK